MDNVISKRIQDGLVAHFYTRGESGYDVTVTDEIVIREIFDEDVYETPFDSLDGKTVLDIGANIGAYTIYCALAGAEVFAYEPDTQNFELLKRNIALNHIEDRVHLFNLGIYKDAGGYRLYNGQGASFIKGSKNLTPDAEKSLLTKGTTSQVIQTITLAEAVKSIGKKVDVCKVDIEGSEYNMFAVAPKEALGTIAYLTMEFHATDDPTYGALLAKLQHTHNIHAFGNPQVGGQIIARSY